MGKRRTCFNGCADRNTCLAIMVTVVTTGKELEKVNRTNGWSSFGALPNWDEEIYR